MKDQSILASGKALTGFNGFSLSERVEYLKQFGNHSQSFSAMQPGMKYFDLPGVGFIGYKQKFGVAFTLGDPICAPEHREHLIGQFLNKFPSASFTQTSEDVAIMMHKRFGYHSTQFGIESYVDLKTWSLKGKKKQILRTSLNQAEKKGIVVKESYAELKTKEISKEWIKTRKVSHKEINFLIRPMVMDYKEGTRSFYAYQDGEPVGFIFFDPIYENNKIVSYVPNISRACASFKQGIWYALMIHAMDVFKEEGVERVDLGLIPLAGLGETQSHESRLLKGIMKFVYEKCNFLYNFKGLHFTKSRFRGNDFKIYYCHKRALPSRDILGIMLLSNLL
jgi:phosphatidylglycerol lysyltransferase